MCAGMLLRRFSAVRFAVAGLSRLFVFSGKSTGRCGALRRRRLGLLAASAPLVVGLIAFLAAQAGSAATYTWSGGGSGLWDDSANWNPNTTWTTTGSVADFTTAGAAVTVNSVTASGVIFGQSTSLSGGTVSLTSGAPFTQTGSTVSIGSTVNILPGTGTNNWNTTPGGTLSISAPIVDNGGGNFFFNAGNANLSNGGSIYVFGRSS